MRSRRARRNKRCCPRLCTRERMWPFLIVQKERRAGDGTTRNRSLRARRSLLPDGIGEPCDAKSLAQQAIDGLGTIYILVNNAAFQRTYEQAQLAPSLSSSVQAALSRAEPTSH